MKITIGRLRRIIREAGLDTDMRNAAMVGMSSGEVPEPPPGLGDEEERKKDNDEFGEQKKSQAGVRRDDRAGHTGR